jgi:hypothetical protein
VVDSLLIFTIIGEQPVGKTLCGSDRDSKIRIGEGLPFGKDKSSFPTIHVSECQQQVSEAVKAID